MYNMFILDEEEKKAFLNVVNSLIQFDKKEVFSEGRIYDQLEKEIFDLNLNNKQVFINEDDIVKEVNKIKKLTVQIYLFNILYEMSKYYDPEEKGFLSNGNKPYIKKIDDILEKTVSVKQIKESSLFTPIKIEKGLIEKVEGIGEGMKDTISKNLNNIFSKKE